MTGFKNFILRGNLVELAVALIMALAFAAVVKATVDLMMGIIGKAGGHPDFSTLHARGAAARRLGDGRDLVPDHRCCRLLRDRQALHRRPRSATSRAPSPVRPRTSSCCRRSATCWSRRTAAPGDGHAADSLTLATGPVGHRPGLVASAVVRRHLRAQPAVAGVLVRRLGARSRGRARRTSCRAGRRRRRRRGGDAAASPARPRPSSAGPGGGGSSRHGSLGHQAQRPLARFSCAACCSASLLLGFFGLVGHAGDVVGVDRPVQQRLGQHLVLSRCPSTAGSACGAQTTRLGSLGSASQGVVTNWTLSRPMWRNW